MRTTSTEILEHNDRFEDYYLKEMIRYREGIIDQAIIWAWNYVEHWDSYHTHGNGD